MTLADEEGIVQEGKQRIYSTGFQLVIVCGPISSRGEPYWCIKIEVS
jgi:hypothetical protein